MRESRTYGSVRGARDEIRVPTATAPHVGSVKWTRTIWSLSAPRRADHPVSGTTTISTFSPTVPLSVASSRSIPRQSGRRGCGRWPLATTKTVGRRTATSRRARPPWRRSPRAGVGSGRDENARVEAVIPNKSLAESNKSDSPVPSYPRGAPTLIDLCSVNRSKRSRHSHRHRVRRSGRCQPNLARPQLSGGALERGRQ